MENFLFLKHDAEKTSDLLDVLEKRGYKCAYFNEFKNNAWHQ